MSDLVVTAPQSEPKATELIFWGSVSLVNTGVKIYSDETLNIIITDHNSSVASKVIKHPLPDLNEMDDEDLLEMVLADVKKFRQGRKPSNVLHEVSEFRRA